MLSNWARASEDLPALIGSLKDGAASVHEALGGVNRAAAGIDRMVADTRKDLVRASTDTLAQLDLLQSAAFFAWANRLMLTLGEPWETD